MASHRRGPWSQGEDAYLVQLVHTQGALNWVRIAQLIGSRSPKQCRERYHQNLKPSLNHEPISPDEGLQIERLVAEMGKRWAEIARRLHGRSDNAVKNWWNGSMNRRRRLVVRRRAPSRDDVDFDDDERVQEASFARPSGSSRRPPSLTGDYAAATRHVDPSLPSPSVSEISRADSIDGAPSLVSDSGSTFSSFSPRAAPSPGLELPPLGAMSSCRRPSLPMLQFSPSTTFASGPDHFISDAGKHHSLGSFQTPLFLRNEHFSRMDQHQSYHESHFDSLTVPPPPVHLPPLQSFRQLSESRGVERDSRMHLSTLLG